MEPDLTCKRCSVRRVNALVKAYEKAHSPDGERWMRRLRKVESLCKTRGFKGAGMLRKPGLSGKELRALCWNASSFIKDDEAESILEVKLR